MKSILTTPHLARANKNLEAHGIDMTTPSQTAKHPMESMGTGKFHGEVKTISRRNKIDFYNTKTRKSNTNLHGVEYKTVGSIRKNPGVFYEGGWYSSERSSRRSVDNMLHQAKSKQK